MQVYDNLSNVSQGYDKYGYWIPDLESLRKFGVEFSQKDRIKGVEIRIPVDVPTSRALGLIYGDGNCRRYYSKKGVSHHIVLTGTKRDEPFYRIVPKVITRAFGLPLQEADLVPSESSWLGKKYTSITPTLRYYSKALGTFLLDHIRFPEGRPNKLTAHVSDIVKNLDGEKSGEFLNHYLAATASFRPSNGTLKLFDLSRDVLKDIKEMLNDFVSADESIILPVKGKRSYKLILYETPTRQLWFSGRLGINPHLRERARQYYG